MKEMNWKKFNLYTFLGVGLDIIGLCALRGEMLGNRSADFCGVMLAIGTISMILGGALYIKNNR